MNCCFHCFQCLCTTTSSSDGGVSTTTTTCSYSCCFDYIKSGNPIQKQNINDKIKITNDSKLQIEQK
jgi:hypothetical protein